MEKFMTVQPIPVQLMCIAIICAYLEQYVIFCQFSITKIADVCYIFYCLISYLAIKWFDRVTFFNTHLGQGKISIFSCLPEMNHLPWVIVFVMTTDFENFLTLKARNCWESRSLADTTNITSLCTYKTGTIHETGYARHYSVALYTRHYTEDCDTRLNTLHIETSFTATISHLAHGDILLLVNATIWVRKI